MILTDSGTDRVIGIHMQRRCLLCAGERRSLLREDEPQDDEVVHIQKVL